MTSDQGGREVSVDSSSGGRPRYAAFISYSHALDDALAPALQSGLEQFGRVWYRRRALRVFRDDSNLSATPHLWGSIEEALSNSEWFILLASPEAARSPWVSREIRWWLEHRSSDRLILGLTAGDIAWNSKNGLIDKKTTNALPRVLVDHRLPSHDGSIFGKCVLPSRLTRHFNLQSPNSPHPCTVYRRMTSSVSTSISTVCDDAG